LYKILIDLDVVTVGLWNKLDSRKDIAKKFIKRIEEDEFILVTPFILIDLISKWNNKNLVSNIKEFYFINSTKIISDLEIEKISELIRIDFNKLIMDLYKIGVKKEDGALVIICSMFNLDYFVTFNRKHLKNKKEVINEVLKENGLKTIKIIEPNEI